MKITKSTAAYIAAILAVLLLCGAVWAAASVIWETEWSLLRQTVTHLLACSLSALPAAYFMHWMPHTVGGILGYFGIFLGIYAGIWLGNYLSVRARIRAMNEKLRGKE